VSFAYECMFNRYHVIILRTCDSDNCDLCNNSAFELVRVAFVAVAVAIYPDAFC
jgi:hypothetical protein